MTEDIKMNLQVDLSKVNKFHKELDEILQAKTEQDQDLVLVNQFIEALDKVSREMQPLDENDNIGYVLITKLKRVYEVYKDTVLSNNDFNYLIDYYSHLQTKDEENQVVRSPIPLFMQLSNHKKMIDTVKVQSDKKEDTEVKLVNLFIADLNQTVDEMEKVEKNSYYEVILEAKLYKLMKVYGDSLCLGSVINIYRSHYNYVFKQREEESYQSVYTGIYFEYKGLSTKVEQLNCVNGDRYSCSDGRLKDSTIPKLYEKFKNKIDS